MEYDLLWWRDLVAYKLKRFGPKHVLKAESLVIFTVLVDN